MQGENAPMLCPDCKTALNMSDRQGVEIDYCPQCRGVWLDRGELDKIIERSVADVRPAPAASAAHGRRDGHDRDARGGHGGHGGKGHRRKTSWLQELFD